MAGKRRGQPPKLTNAVLDEVLRCVGLGMPMKWAAAAAGITEQSVYGWIKLAKAGKNGLHAKLLSGVKTGRGGFLSKHLENVQKHAEKQWQGSAWLIERTFPEYSPQRVEIFRMQKEIKELRALLQRISPADVTPEANRPGDSETQSPDADNGDNQSHPVDLP